jgi:hypothetical protein
VVVVVARKLQQSQRQLLLPSWYCTVATAMRIKGKAKKKYRNVNHICCCCYAQTCLCLVEPRCTRPNKIHIRVSLSKIKARFGYTTHTRRCLERPLKVRRLVRPLLFLRAHTHTHTFHIASDRDNDSFDNHRRTHTKMKDPPLDLSSSAAVSPDVVVAVYNPGTLVWVCACAQYCPVPLTILY